MDRAGDPVLDPVIAESHFHLIVDELTELKFELLKQVMSGICAGETDLFFVVFFIFFGLRLECLGLGFGLGRQSPLDPGDHNALFKRAGREGGQVRI